MDNIKPSFRGAVYAIFKKEDKILLIKRKNTTWYDGFYSLPAGRLSKNEYPTSGIIREVLEEVGVKIKKEDLEPVYFAARHDNRNGVPISTYFEVFFIIKKWEGELRNVEKDNCEKIKWFDIKFLPEKTIPFIKIILNDIKNKNNYGEISSEL